jgi:hypothetical protein
MNQQPTKKVGGPAPMRDTTGNARAKAKNARAAAYRKAGKVNEGIILPTPRR